MKVLITGITGFVGSHLTEFLLENHKDLQIFGLKRWRSPLTNLSSVINKVNFVDGELRDLASILKIINDIQPDIIFHLAAQSYVTSSFNYPSDTYNTNIIGTNNLLEAVRISGSDPTIHVCSSSEVYGDVSSDHVPIDEDCPLNPVSPYGISKLAEDMIARMYFKAYGIKTIISRMFTHSGPRRGDVFVDSAFSLQIARIEKGLQEPVLKVGNLDSVRTFCDVRDTVRAYWDLVEKGEPGSVYNIGGDTTLTIKEMVNLLLKKTVYNEEIKIFEDPSLRRPTDVTLQIPTYKKFKNLTGWTPKISYDQTLEDMLNYWRKEIDD